MIGKSLESPAIHDRAALLRASERYWHLFPFQLLIIGVVALLVVSRVHNGPTSRKMRALQRLLMFVGIFPAILVLDYFGGALLPSAWSFALVRLLER